MSRLSIRHYSAEELSIGLGALWGLFVISLGAPLLGGESISFFPDELGPAAVGGMLATLIGSQVGRLAYHASKHAYEESKWVLLYWAPVTLALAGAVFGFFWGLFLGGPFASLYGAFYGLVLTVPIHNESLVAALVFQTAALGTHVLVRSAHRHGPASRSETMKVREVAGKAWLPQAVALLPGLVYGLMIAPELNLLGGFLLMLWCALASRVAYGISRHTYPESPLIQIYWGPLMLIFLVTLCRLPIDGRGVFWPAWQDAWSGGALFSAMAVQLVMRWLDRRYRPYVPPQGAAPEESN